MSHKPNQSAGSARAKYAAAFKAGVRVTVRTKSSTRTRVLRRAADGTLKWSKPASKNAVKS